MSAATFDPARPLGVADEAFWADPWPNRHPAFDACRRAPRAILADGPALVPRARATAPLAFIHSAPVREAALRPILRTAVLVATRLEDGLTRAGPAFDPPALPEPAPDPGPPPPPGLGGPVLDRTRHLVEDVAARLDLPPGPGRWVLRVLQHDLASNPVTMRLEREGEAPDPAVTLAGVTPTPAPPPDPAPPAAPPAPGIVLGGPGAAFLQTLEAEEPGADAPAQRLVPPALPVLGAVRAPRADALVLRREAGDLLALPLSLVVTPTGDAAAAVVTLLVLVEPDGGDVVGTFAADLRAASGGVDLDAPRTLLVHAAARSLWAGPHRLVLVPEADVGRAPAR